MKHNLKTFPQRGESIIHDEYQQWKEEFEAELRERCPRCKRTAEALGKPVECEFQGEPKFMDGRFWHCNLIKVKELLGE